MKEDIKLHNATWPGLVGKGPDSEPVIPLDKMLELTKNTQVDGISFDGVDIGLLPPHFDVEEGVEGAKKLADKVALYNLEIGSLVAPIWSGNAMGSVEERDIFIDMVKKSCEVGQELKKAGIRKRGIVRIDSACSVEDWTKDPIKNTKLIIDTFQRACDIAADYGETLAAEGEICWGGMHSWKNMLRILEGVNRKNIGFQADMAHTLLYTMGYNSPEDRILPADYDWEDKTTLDNALRTLTDALRPWTIDFHVAQNDGSVFGSGSHDVTGRHCRSNDPNGKLNIPYHAGFWLTDKNGAPNKNIKHLCWDGCMFTNEIMMKQDTWEDILSVMIAVKNKSFINKQ